MSISESDIAQFNQDGYIFRRGLFDAEETAMMLTAARNTQAIQENAADIEDADGKISRLTLWNHPGDDIFGRCRQPAPGVCNRRPDNSRG